MLQNDMRMSRSISSSYEVSAQSLLSKLIQAKVETQLLANMESATYSQLSSLPFICDDDSSCNTAINNRLTASDNLVYQKLIGYDGLFANIIENIYMAVEGSGTTYALEGSAYSLQSRFSYLISSVNPFQFSTTSDEKYSITLSPSSFSPADFAVGFKDASIPPNRMTVSIVPSGYFDFTTSEPLYDLLQKIETAFLSVKDCGNMEDSEMKDNIKYVLDNMDGIKYVNQVSFKKTDILGIIDCGLTAELNRGYSGNEYSVSFHTLMDSEGTDFTCSPDINAVTGAGAFDCS
jgi:hypothetical protein